MTLSDKELGLQRECDRFVQSEIMCCVSFLISEIGGRDLRIEESEWFDEWLTLTKPIEENCGCDMDEEELREAEENDEEKEPCGNCFREIFEHWVVTRWMADTLRERGEVVVDFMNLDVWARTTTGQSIALDGVIRDIIKERIREREERELKYG